MAELTQAYYFIGTIDGIYTKVYDGRKLQANSQSYEGYANTDTVTFQITDGEITHVNQYETMEYDENLGKNIGTLDLLCDDGYPKVFRNGVEVTSEYNQTQVADSTFEDKTPGNTTFTIVSRDITLQSETLTKEYDGTALVGGGNVTDLTAGMDDKGYVSGEEFTYTFTGSQLFVGESDNEFNVSSNDTALTTDYNVTKTYGKLKVTKRTTPLTITVTDQEKMYDGTATIQAAEENVTYTVDGRLASGDTISVTLNNSYVNVGTYTDCITATYKIVHDNGDGTTTDVTDMYANVTVDNGDLTVTWNQEVVITAGSKTQMYDGTALSDSTCTVTGLAAGHTIDANTAGEIIHYGTAANEVTDYTILDENGNDVTAAYSNVTTIDGTLTITKRDATLTSGSASQMYDGTTLTNETVTVTGSGFISGEGANYYGFASQTTVGSTDNTFSYVLANGTSADDYAITTANGTLTVTQNDTLITITAASDSKMYDGSALTNDGYSMTGSLVAGHTITVDIAGSITDAGTVANVIDSYTIYDENGQDVTSFYSNIQKVNGTLEVTTRSVTLTSASDEKPYDGTPLTNSSVSVTGDGWAGNEGASYNVTGSQTALGSSANTFTYTLNDGTKEGNYEIATVEGTLTVTPAEFIITIDTEIGSGLEFLYDNTSTKELTPDQYQIEGLVEGDQVVNVTITTNSSNAGTYDEDMYTLTYDIVNAAGESTKSNYILTEYKHDVDITKRTITISADSASKVYDSTELTCHTYTVEEGETEEYQLLDGEAVEGVGFTDDSTISHAGSTANKIDACNVTINKADGSDSSMNYNILTEDGTLTVTQRGVMLASTSDSKYYDGTALQNRQVIITGFYYDENGNVVVDSEGGFLAGDNCSYDFVNDNYVDAGTSVSEQVDTAYGQTEVGTSKNEFNYNNFTSTYAGSYVSDYLIMYGFNQEELGLSKDVQDLFGDLTVWGGQVEINMTDYSWTYDYQAKTNGYFDDGYTVVVTTNEEGTEQETTEIAHNSEGYAIPLLGNDTIVVTVNGQGGSAETGKVQHVDNTAQNIATYTIYRDDVDVTSEVEKYYQISITGGTLSITPRTVELTSASDTKVYDGTELTNNTVIESKEDRDAGFIYGEGASYEVTGSQTEVGSSKNEFKISQLIDGTNETDYNIVKKYGDLVVTAEGDQYFDSNAIVDASIDVEKLSIKSGCTLTVSESGSVKAEEVVLDGNKLDNNGSFAASKLTVSGENTVDGNVCTFANIDLKDQSTLNVSRKQYDNIISCTTFTDSGDGVLNVGTADAALTTSDVETAMAKQDLYGVNFEQELTDLKKLTIKNAGEAKVIAFNGATGTDKNDTIRVQKGAEITLKSAGEEMQTIDLAGGKNTIQIDKDADAKLLFNIDNVSSVNAAAGSEVELGNVTGSSKATLTTGKETVFTAADVDAFAKINLGTYSQTELGNVTGSSKATLATGKEAVFTAADVDAFAKINLGTYSQTELGNVSGVQKITLNMGTRSKGATLKAEIVTGTAGNDTFTFGRYNEVSLAGISFGDGNDALKFGDYAGVKVSGLVDFGNGNDQFAIGKGIEGAELDDVAFGAGNDKFTIGSNNSEIKLDDLAFGMGNDTFTIGNNSEIKLNDLDFGDGNDKLSIGKGAILSVDTLDVDSLEKLTMGKGAELRIADSSSYDAAQEKWGAKYGEQITLA